MPKCRFCGNLIIDGYTGNLYCQEKEKKISDSYAKRKRECEHYAFCDIDMFFEMEYKEEYTKRKKPKNVEQISIDEILK